MSNDPELALALKSMRGMVLSMRESEHIEAMRCMNEAAIALEESVTGRKSSNRSLDLCIIISTLREQEKMCVERITETQEMRIQNAIKCLILGENCTDSNKGGTKIATAIERMVRVASLLHAISKFNVMLSRLK